MTYLKQQQLISSPPLPWTEYTVLSMSIALEVMKLVFAVLNVSFNSGHYTVVIKLQFLYINICSFSAILILSTRSH